MIDKITLIESLRNEDKDFIMPIQRVTEEKHMKTMDTEKNNKNSKVLIYICKNKYQLVCYMDKTNHVMIDINIQWDEEKYSTVSYYTLRDTVIQDMIVKDISKYFTIRYDVHVADDLSDKMRVKKMLSIISNWYLKQIRG